MEKLPTSENEELDELIVGIRRNNQVHLLLFSVLLLFSLILKWQNIEFPWAMIGITALLLFINVLSEYLTQNVWSRQTVSQANFGYFIIQIIEIFTLLTGFYFFQTIFFGGIGIIMVYIIFSYFVFTQGIYPQIIVFLCITGYIILGLLTHFKILNYYSLSQDPLLFITNISLTIGLLICLAFYGDVFSKRLRDTIGTLKTRTNKLSLKENQLFKKEEELKASKAVFENEIEKKTKETKDLVENLSQAKQKEKELREKIGELERFYKLAVDRELKMAELKKEVQKLKEKLETCQKEKKK